MKQNGVELTLTNQLLRSGTSIGANVHEAQYAQSKNDFVSKLEIALKECSESEYWLGLIFATGGMSENDFSAFSESCTELRRMLIASVKTVKANSPI